jgi:hypothetical protein
MDACCCLQTWVNSVGKAQKRKGKRLFMPMRIIFTGRMQVGVCGGVCLNNELSLSQQPGAG